MMNKLARLTTATGVLCMFVIVSYKLTGRVYKDQLDSGKNKCIESFKMELSKGKRIIKEESGNTTLQRVRNHGLVVLPPKDSLKEMSLISQFQTFHSYLANIDIVCHRMLRMGNIADGGWEVCDDDDYRPVKPCLVYSFGISNDFSFDDDVAKNYQCNVFSFDHTIKLDSYQRSPLVHFYKLGIAGNESEKTHTVGYYKTKFNHTEKVIDVLKMDVEGWEWRSLPQMIKSGDLSHVRQLLVEYHDWQAKGEKIKEDLGILKDLFDIGFRKFYVHKNSVCKYTDDSYPVTATHCYEVHYVNVNIRD